MTCGELRQAVLHLGIAEGFDDTALEAAFPDAATRALAELSRLRPRRARTVVTHSPILPMCDPVSFRHERDSVAVSYAGAVSFCFYISGGSGTLTVRIGARERTLAINGAPRTFISYRIRDLFPDFNGEDIELIFGGDYFYKISELCFFDLLTSDGKVTPPSEACRYDISLIAPDFLRFSADPVCTEDGTVPDFFIEGASLLIPRGVPDGDYNVFYEHKPEKVTLDTVDTEELDCDSDVSDLLPLITAFYLWIDDFPDKAQIFYQRYAEQASLVRDKREIRERQRFISVNNW
jgi:hypothetical protein